ncbi:MAG: succinate dehydrogenase iron-sulfur subunit [Candidatus Glassbacteria bacterium]|nr:succinate dehydrogenase iron-sulfur subunit [Candidatus Glassbacteria bacterium]
MTDQHKDYEGKVMTFRILRFDPDKDSEPHFQEYKIELKHGMTILDALMHIKETQDPTLSYRKSCRMGICGSCAMQVNGFPQLTCQTQIVEISTQVIEVRPLANYPIIRDLVPDLGDFMAQHESVLPYLIRSDTDEQDNPSGEYYQSPDELEEYLQFAYCIKCGACLAACPTNATDRKFTGPQALAAAFRYAADSRDEGLGQRLDALEHPNSLFRCHYAGACSEACPKGVDPSLGIQLLKRDLLKRKVFGHKQKPAQLAKTPEGIGRREGIPEAPEKTV